MTRTVFLVALLPAALAAQSGAIAGVVVARGTGEPLGYSIVGVERMDATIFTSDSGRFTIRNVPAGPQVLHVRRLGFTPRDLVVQVQAGTTDTVTVELDHVALTLGTITVQAWPPCTNPGQPPASDSALSTIVVQLMLNAEQFRFLQKQYPYQYTVEVRRSARIHGASRFISEPVQRTKYTSTSNRPYKPGHALEYARRNYYFQIPELPDIADPLFLAAHCWHFAGVDTVDDLPHYRVDIVAADTLEGVDVNGSFLVDSRSFQIRRSVLYLSRPPTQVKGVLNLETTTEFFEVLPSIPIISHVRAVQTIDPAAKSLYDENVEEHRTISFRFKGRKPGDPRKP